jgi:hypothetical protein
VLDGTNSLQRREPGYGIGGISLQLASFPIKYLGIPLSVTKLPKEAFPSLVDQAADRLPTWKGCLMRRSGQLILIKTTLQAIPIYVSISLQLPPLVLKALEKMFKAFL